MAPPTRVVRIKKLSKSQGQTILREDQIDDYDSLQSQYTVDTGVEKSEEKVRSYSFVANLFCYMITCNT